MKYRRVMSKHIKNQYHLLIDNRRELHINQLNT